MKKLIFSLILSSIFSLCQAQTGSISGTVIEVESGFTVIGANIVISGSTTGTATDLDGKYLLDNLTPGLYSIECTSLGFDKKNIKDIEVVEGESTSINIKMGEGTVDLGGLNITVTAEVAKNTETALLTMQKKSTSILDGISSSQISKSGDRDAASAIKRITGVTIEGGKYVYVRGLGDRYSKTTLNGADIPSLDPNKNTVQIDLFPTNLLDNILVYKTFSPDLPGDFTGGYVDIQTKDFPETFNFNISGSLGYNNQSTFNENFLSYKGGKLDWLGFDDGSRSIPEQVANTAQADFPSYQLGSTFDATQAQKLTDLTNSFSNSWEFQNKIKPFNHNLSVSVGNQFKLGGKIPLGVIAAVTYQRKFSGYQQGQYAIYELSSHYDQATGLSPQLQLNDSKGTDNVLWGTMFSLSIKPSPNDKISFMAMHNQSATSTARRLEGRKQRDDPDDIFQTASWRFLERGLSTFQLSGKHIISKLKNFEVKWQSSYAMSSQDDPDLRYFTNRYQPDVDRYFIKPSSDRTPTRFYRNMQQGNLSNRIDLVMPFKQWGSLSSKIKMGGSHVYKQRSFRETRYSFDNLQTTFDGTATNYFSADNILSLSEEQNGYTNGGSGVYVVDNYDPANNYDANQTVWGAYAMVELPLFRKLKLITGLRMEKTEVKFTTFSDIILGKYPQLDGQSKLLNNLDFLPSVSLNYEVSKKMKLRGVFSRTLARPTFREIAPYASFDVEGGYLFIGNPDLQRTLVSNADLRWEFYPTAKEMISVSGFYKNFNNPIERTYNPEAANGEFTYRNVKHAMIAGAELELRTNLGFIHKNASNFSLATNFSYIYSRTDIDEQELQQIQASNPYVKEYREMYGQSPFAINALLSYKNKKGTDANLVFNIVGPKISYITMGGTPNIYTLSRPSLKFNISQKIKKGFVFRFSADNLLNAKYREAITFKDEKYYVLEYPLGMSFSLGISYSFTK